MSGEGLDRFGVVISSLYFLRLCLKLSQISCSPSGSQVGFHETSTNLFLRDLEFRNFYSCSFRLTPVGQARVSLVSIATCSLAL
jgi:hypothetical protein